MRPHPLKKYNIGCTGWSLADWKGTFYTDDAKPSDFLSQYATVFNSVEGNTTFYNIPDAQTVLNWGNVVPDGFKFCFKIHRSITHKKLLRNTGDDILHFLDVFQPINHCLGPFMIQLPPQFSYQQIDNLETTLALLPAHYNYGVEVRHDSFFDQGKQERQLNRLLATYNVDRIIFDTRKLHALKSGDDTVISAQKRKPNMPVRFNATGSRPIVRYVGSNDVLNNETLLKEWAIVIADWIKEGKHPYMFTHAPNKVGQPPIARRFHQLLAQFVDLNDLPATSHTKSSQQQELF